MHRVHTPSRAQGARTRARTIEPLRTTAAKLLAAVVLVGSIGIAQGVSVVANATAASAATAVAKPGYRMLASDGSVYGFGSMRGNPGGSGGAISLANRPHTSGYWVVNVFGGVFAYGGAPLLGGSPQLLWGEHISTISATPSGKGYWLFSNRGRVFPYGDARSFGDLSRLALVGPIIASVATPTGHGYYLVGSDGGVFAFGDAHFHGSMGNRHLNRPIVGISPTPNNRGYWEVASDGGVFAFNAPFRGSMGGRRLSRPVTGLVAFGNGYLMVATDGGVFDFSNKPFLGSLAGRALPGPIVAIAAGTAVPGAGPSIPPPATGPWPSPSTTGWAPTGVTLKAYSGPSTITTNGTVIDGRSIPFALVIRANNVTITRSRILGSTGDDYVVQQASGHTGLTLRNVEVGPQTASDHPDRAIASFGTYMTLDHVYVHGTQRGIQTGNNTKVRNSYSDNFYNSSQNHATAVMSLGGTQHVTLEHNTFGCDTGECSSAMSVYPQNDFGGPNNDWTIDSNLFNGGGYCVYLGYTPSAGESPNTNMRVTNNAFGVTYHPLCGQWGPVASWSTGGGNLWAYNSWYAPGSARNGRVVLP